MPDEQAIYFHGAPGGPAELGLFGPPPAGLHAPDRFLDRPDLPLDRYLDVLANELDARFAGAPLRLIGFSLGARIALEAALRLGGRVSAIELIAPAAPLQLGDFLPRMEGRAVFALARDTPALFGAVVWLQGVACALFPERMFRLVFAHPAGGDVALAADPAFAAAITALLRRSLGPGARGYSREVRAFTRPWDDILPRITAPVRIWHGAADNWTPPDMAAALVIALPGATAAHALEGLSHYSTLGRALRAFGAGRGLS